MSDWIYNTIKTYELIPKNGRKSFYGKAKVEQQVKFNTNEKCKLLLSYGTDIVRIWPDGSCEVILDPEDELFSRTTCAHVKSFCGLTKSDIKKIWNGLMTEQQDYKLCQIVKENY